MITFGLGASFGTIITLGVLWALDWYLFGKRPWPV